MGNHLVRAQSRHARDLAYLLDSWLARSVLLAALGLLLGVGVLKSFIKDPTANAKMDQTIARLAPKQGVLGLIGIGLGIWTVISSVLFMG